jgi:hypothetical protein
LNRSYQRQGYFNYWPKHTTADRFLGVEQHVAQHYPADAPETIALPITVGSHAYLEWIRVETRWDNVDGRPVTGSANRGQ